MDATLGRAGLLSRARSLAARQRGKHARDEPAGPDNGDARAGAGAAADSTASDSMGTASTGTASTRTASRAGDGTARGGAAAFAARRPPPVLPAPAGGLPARLRGREGLLERLGALVWAPDGRTHVLAGPGGAGKTAIALSVARDAARRGVPVWWVPAADPRLAAVSLLDLAADLGARPGEVAQAGAGQRDIRLSVLWGCLEQRTPWLLVLDGADDGRKAGGLAGWLRRTHVGLILVTSRAADRRDWGRHAELHAVGPLDPAAGGQVLADLAPRAGNPPARQRRRCRSGAAGAAAGAAARGIADRG